MRFECLTNLVIMVFTRNARAFDLVVGLADLADMSAVFVLTGFAEAYSLFLSARKLWWY